MATIMTATTDERQEAIRKLHDAIGQAGEAMTAVYHALIELNQRGDVEAAKTQEMFQVASWAVHELRRAAPDSLTGTEPKAPLAVTSDDLTAIMKAKGLID